MNSQDLVKIIRNTYPSPAFATLEQVRNQTGYATSTIRTADAITLSLFPSRGIFMAGFEIKVNRSDWLKELADPEKAEEIQKYCDYWYIVAPDLKIVNAFEIPENWGLAIPNRTRLKIVKKAPKLQTEKLSTSILCGLLRNVTENFIDKREIEGMLRQRFQDGENHAKISTKYDLQDFEKLKAKVMTFEEKSGVKIDNWYYPAGQIGEAVKMVLEGRHTQERERLRSLKDDVSRIIERIDEALNKPINATT